MNDRKKAFESLTFEEFNDFCTDAAKLQEQVNEGNRKLENLLAQLKEAEATVDQLTAQQAESDRISALTAVVSELRSQADLLLASGRISAFQYDQYFDLTLSADVDKFANDPVELKVSQRFVEASKCSQLNQTVNFSPLVTAGGDKAAVTFDAKDLADKAARS